MSSTLSNRLRQTQSTKKDVGEMAEKLGTALKLIDEADESIAVAGPESGDAAAADDDDDDWEKLADKELETPVEPTKKPPSIPLTSAVLELYDFDPQIPMHQLVKDLTRMVDPTATMLFRPKMVGQSLMMTFNNPKHATTVLYNYSCITPQDPLGKLRRSDGTPMSRSSSTNSLPPAPACPARIRSASPSSRPLTTDTVARRFIAGHLGIRAASSPERKEYDRLVRNQVRQEKAERDRLKQKEEQEQRRREEELKNVWDEG